MTFYFHMFYLYHFTLLKRKRDKNENVTSLVTFTMVQDSEL